MKKNLLIVVRNRKGDLIDGALCDYSFKLDELIERFEVGDTFEVCEPRQDKPEPAPIPDENADNVVAF